MEWLTQYIASTRETDRFRDNPKRIQLLASGLMGEAGSVLTELKKGERERNAYPVYRNKMQEEVGDLLWYFVRLIDAVSPNIYSELRDTASSSPSESYSAYLDLGGAVGSVLEKIKDSGDVSKDPAVRAALLRVWQSINDVARKANSPLEKAASSNLSKIKSRWPTNPAYAELFDDEYELEEQLPRKIEIEFLERNHGGRKTVFLRCNGLNFGNRLTDNIESQDGYRFHDVFHFAYAVHLGWSPVMRALMECKRKSTPDVDEAQDGARAIIIEEAVSAIAFSRAKKLAYFDGLENVDYDLLKTIKEFVEGFEVASVSLWQWEVAILEGFRLFRLLRNNGGGTINLDIEKRELTYTAPIHHGK